GVVVHELHGHPEYGDTSLGANLFAQVAKQLPPEERPHSAADEGMTWGYPEGELYSSLKEIPYGSHGLSAPPQYYVQMYVDMISKQWAPVVGQAMLHGLYRRFRESPGLNEKSIAAFENAVNERFEAEPEIAAAILK